MPNMSRRRFTLFGTALATVGLPACGGGGGSPAAPAAPAASTATPQFGAWGFDLTAMDKSVRPGVDFNRYANGAWLDHTLIPSDQSIVSLRTQISDRIEARLREIMEGAPVLEGAPATLEDKVGAFYRSFMNEQRIESLGVEPIRPELDAVRAAADRTALARLMGQNPAGLFGTIFNVRIDVDLKDVSRYAVVLSQPDLGLPDRDYYLDASNGTVRAAYRNYVEQLLRLGGLQDAAARADAVVAFETAVARVMWTNVEQRDQEKTYNPLTVAELQALAPQFAWTDFLAAAGLPDTGRLIVSEKSAFPAIAAVYGATPLETIRSWLSFTVLDNAASYLPAAFAQAYFDFRQKVLLGQNAQADRWKRAVVAVGGPFNDPPKGPSYGTMDFGVGQLYTARFFPPEAKAKIEALVANLKAAMRTRLQQADWMAPTTRAEAVDKLDTYVIKVGYPDQPRDYAGLQIRADDLLGNVRRSRAWDWAFHVSRSKGPVNRDDWLLAPQANDALQGTLRDLVFPAGILQPPMFDPAADDAVNYGAVGAVIGHEISHGFDDQGRKVDAKGELRDWWTADDAREFTARASRLGSQFAAYEPYPGVRVNPDLTMGENIADLGGVDIALDAYRQSLRGATPAVLDGFSGEQRFFLGWAQAWRGKATESYVRQQVATDAHAPRQYRINGPVRNVDAWYAVFEVKPGDALYLEPGQRVRIT